MTTGLYAGILAILFVALSFKVIAKRMKFKVGLGDGGHEALIRAQRAHGNFAENIPFALLLVLLVEMQASDVFAPTPWYIHAMGITLIIGRVFHAYSLIVPTSPLLFRQIGMISTYLTMLAAAGLLIAGFVTA